MRATTRLKLVVRGAVQGVGFRPFVYRLASELQLAGWVSNSPQGVFIEVEGTEEDLEQFRHRLEPEKPPRSFIQSLEATWLDSVGCDGFVIRESEEDGNTTALVLPDIATCPDCLREIFDPTNRRHRYPFTNCTNCGPRFSIIEALPYDRANTSMRGFEMCPACQTEYDDPGNRRFHAQPNACPVCGPKLELWEPGAGRPPVQPLARGHAALLAGVEAILHGQIVAVKGIGGFHLLVDARNAGAVSHLRERKHREEKPFALLFPSLPGVKRVCEVSLLEERLLLSPEAPMVLLRRRSASSLRTPALPSHNVAPGNPNLGVMLPSNPLHHLLMAALGFPVVATSGNLSDEPICIDEHEVLDRLRGIADVFLVHNRPIVRHMDDSIVQVILGHEMVLRRARGYAPLPVQIQDSKIQNPSILAVGAHLKNSIALAVGEQVFLSQHIGDLETEQANTAFRRAAADLPRLYGTAPDIIAADLHPDYLPTKFALEHQLPVWRESENLNQPPAAQEALAPRVVQVQHHIAHVLSCIAENEVNLPALGVAWDGTGYGTEGTIWGGEFFIVRDDAVERCASLRPFRLPGGDAAVKEPRRAALGLLQELADHHDQALLHLRQKFAGRLSSLDRAAWETAMARGLNSPWCSSVGRLFDAVAALVGLRQQSHFEGQAAIELEFALDGIETGETYELPFDRRHSPMQLDWSVMIAAIAADLQRGISVGEIAARFHNTLVEAIVRVAQRIACPRVALSGGCFQNRYLTEHTVTRLREAGFQPYCHQRVPTNDGGIALGQVFATRLGLTLKS